MEKYIVDNIKKTLRREFSYISAYLLATSFGITICMVDNPSFAASSSCNQRIINTSKKLQECMTIEGLVSHLKAFQEQANANKEVPETRFIGTSGYDGSRDYVVKKLTEAGYTVTLQNVPVAINYVTTPRVFEQKFPAQKVYADNIDYAPLVNSGVGDITGKVQVPSGNILGCNTDDFIGFNAGNIALVQHGGMCSGRDKVVNAVAAGAKAIIIFNSIPGIFFAALAASSPSKTTPVVFASQEVGNELKTQVQTGTLPVVHIKFDALKTFTNSQNIIADSSTGNPDHVVIAGAHLDSSAGNAGMNDNASAAATILETALLMKNTKPANKLRFAWWTGEEEGLIGSTYYISHLDAKEKAKISLYLNYEILGAPNGGRMIMGAADGVTPPGSEKIVKLYTDYFNSQNLKSYVFDPKMANAVARSDMFAFMQAGIPVGYLVSGAEVPWNPLLTAIFTDLPKRIEGLATHPCYHKLCDKLTLIEGEMKDPNFDFDLYLQMSKAAAYAIYTYSMNTNI